MSQKIIPVILSGGSGTRLWPVSRHSFPKQFWPLISQQTLIQQTVLRSRAVSDAAPLIICNAEHRFIVAEQMRHIGITSPRIVLEPEARNSGPAIAAAAYLLAEEDPNTIMWVMAADSLIRDEKALKESFDLAVKAAHKAISPHLVSRRTIRKQVTVTLRRARRLRWNPSKKAPPFSTFGALLKNRPGTRQRR